MTRLDSIPHLLPTGIFPTGIATSAADLFVRRHHHGHMHHSFGYSGANDFGRSSSFGWAALAILGVTGLVILAVISLALGIFSSRRGRRVFFFVGSGVMVILAAIVWGFHTHWG